jgi:DNA-binding response OmpR family regulator
MLKSRPSAAALPIIVISAQAEKGRKSAGAKALNVVDWMEKPIDMARLRRAVAAALATTAPSRRPVILHVDDDHDILRVTAAALSTCGEVVSVEGLASARAFMAARTPDLVILDLALGDGWGLELLAELNDADGAPIPVLIFSAHDADKVVPNRVHAVMTKSRTSLDELAEAVRRLIQAAPSQAPEQRRLAS